MFHHFKEPVMITDGHMQYLFDEKGKRYALKEGFFSFSSSSSSFRSTPTDETSFPFNSLFLPSTTQVPRRLRRDRHRLRGTLPPSGPESHPGAAGEEIMVLSVLSFPFFLFSFFPRSTSSSFFAHDQNAKTKKKNRTASNTPQPSISTPKSRSSPKSSPPNSLQGSMSPTSPTRAPRPTTWLSCWLGLLLETMIC